LLSRRDFLEGVEPEADGADRVRIYARVCGVRGRTHPGANDLITFSVRVEGAILGDAKIVADPVRAEEGIATALLRTTKFAAPVNVHALAPGLKEAYAQFPTVSDSSLLAP
jgi:hypothetical protein